MQNFCHRFASHSFGNFLSFAANSWTCRLFYCHIWFICLIQISLWPSKAFESSLRRSELLLEASHFIKLRFILKEAFIPILKLIQRTATLNRKVFTKLCILVLPRHVIVGSLVICRSHAPIVDSIYHEGCRVRHFGRRANATRLAHLHILTVNSFHYV